MHVDTFLEIYSTALLNNISNDALCFLLLSFSLKDKGKASLDTNTSISTYLGSNAKGILEENFLYW